MRGTKTGHITVDEENFLKNYGHEKKKGKEEGMEEFIV